MTCCGETWSHLCPAEVYECELGRRQQISAHTSDCREQIDGETKVVEKREVLSGQGVLLMSCDWTVGKKRFGRFVRLFHLVGKTSKA